MSMENKLEKKYGLPTAICMVVGIVIGSGVFFKAEAVLNKTGGNMPMGILAWLIVGAIMVICSYVFATMATKYEKVNGLVDYAEATLGDRYAYNIGWFMATIYVPCLTSVLAWVSARYFSVLMGWDITGGSCMTIAAFFLCMDIKACSQAFRYIRHRSFHIPPPIRDLLFSVCHYENICFPASDPDGRSPGNEGVPEHERSGI